MLLGNLLIYAFHDYSIRVNPDAETDNMTLNNVEIICNLFFLYELIQNIIVQGVIAEQGTYFRNWYNILEIFIFLFNCTPGWIWFPRLLVFSYIFRDYTKILFWYTNLGRFYYTPPYCTVYSEKIPTDKNLSKF